MSGNWYVSDVSHLDEEELKERLETFSNEGTPSIIFDGDYSLLEDLDIYIDESDVTVVELD